MARGIYLGAYASTRTGDDYILAWEVYWLLPWPIPSRVPTTVRALQTRLLDKSRGFWLSVLGKWEAEGGSLESRVTLMELELTVPRLTNQAIAIHHRTKKGRRAPTMSFQSLDMDLFPITFKGNPPARPIGYRNWRGTWPLGFCISLDHDPFKQMQVKMPPQGRSVRMLINAAFRMGAKVRYRTSASGTGRHIIIRTRKRPKPQAKFALRRNLADDSARNFLDEERWQQLQGEPAAKLRPSGVLWDRRRSFDLETLALAPESFAGRWRAWRTRGALSRKK